MHPNSLPLQLVVTPPSNLFQPITGASYQQIRKKLSLSGNTRHESDSSLIDTVSMVSVALMMLLIERSFWAQPLRPTLSEARVGSLGQLQPTRANI
jgi:hypothetical protein